MVACGTINCGHSSSKNKTSDVKGWHKVPTSDKLERMKWVHVMRRDTPCSLMKIFTFVVFTLKTIASSDT